jgi:hypothetical protein
MSGGGKFGFAGYASSVETIVPPATQSVATSSSGNYDNAFTIYQVGSTSLQFESGSGFTSGSGVATLSAATFNSRRDRSMGFGAYARNNGTGTVTYSWTLAETTAFSTGTICTIEPTCAYNQIQDNLTVNTTTPASGDPDGGVGLFVKFSSGPSALDYGVYTVKCAIIYGGTTYNTTTPTCTITFT